MHRMHASRSKQETNSTPSRGRSVAVVGRPTLVLADEPTGRLDSRSGLVITDLLAQLSRGGTTICIATHDPQLAACASRTIHLRDGATVSV
jgi:putative ABC transport system ATP-binding protein